jgi:hypothetical protein
VGQAKGRVRRLKIAWSRRREQRGSVLVEAVLIIPVVMLLTFGAIEFGLGFSQKGGLESVARSGARKASTLSGVPDTASKHEIGDQTAAAVNGALGSTSLPAKMNWLYVYRVDSSGNQSGDANGCGPIDCMTYEYNPSASPPQFEYVDGTWPLADRDSCSVTPDRVGVTVVGEFRFITGLFGPNGITLSPTSILQLEPTSCDG